VQRQARLQIDTQSELYSQVEAEDFLLEEDSVKSMDDSVVSMKA
jgi:hypothetical protein